MQAARDAMARGDSARCLALLLDAWRDTRDPALADLIDRVSAHAAKPWDVVFPSSRRHQSLRWRVRSERHDICELPALLAGWSVFFVIEELAKWPDDPRIAKKIVERISQTYRTEQAAACALLARLGDHRGLPALREAGPPWSEIEMAEHGVVDGIAEIDALLARTIAEEQARAQDRQARFARVYDNPHDLAERAVLADWLLERNDPRGEFIALQLATPTRENLRRVKQLLRANRRAFLGDLREAIFGGHFQFERGFLASCSIDMREIDDVKHTREWATLTSVSLEHDGERGRTFAPLFPKLPLLEDISGMGTETFEALVTGASPNVRSLSFDARRVQTPAIVRELAALPHLRSVTISYPRDWFVGGGAWQRLESVAIIDDLERAGYWLDVFARPYSARLRTLTLLESFLESSWTFRFTRPARLRIVLQSFRWARDQRTRLLLALRSIPDRSLDSIRIDEPVDGIEDELARIRR